ncbi:MAG: hypothetical protein CME86_25325 [Herbaspirillum sp.]|nr:hypothetical protein [Herbaspirillum sp.]
MDMELKDENAQCESADYPGFAAARPIRVQPRRHRRGPRQGTLACNRTMSRLAWQPELRIIQRLFFFTA